MSIRDDRRAETLGHIAQQILQHGLPGASLRSLAAAAGVSDRMLLYYFTDKNEMLTAALGLLARQMAAVLDQTVPREPERPFEALLAEIRAATSGPVLRPYMHLWLEIAARAARAEEPYAAVSGLMADGFALWISSRLEAGPAEEAARLLAMAEGFAVLDAVGRSHLADRAAGLPPYPG